MTPPAQRASMAWRRGDTVDTSSPAAAVSWRVIAEADVSWNLYDTADRMRTRGWLVPAYSLPAHPEDLSSQRVLPRHGFTYELARLFLDDLQRSDDALNAHPPTASMTEAEAGTSCHSGQPASS